MTRTSVLIVAILMGLACNAPQETPIEVLRQPEEQVFEELMTLLDGAMERWRQGDPGGWAELAGPEITYFDPGHNHRIDQILRVGNFNEARYKAIELGVLKRLSRRWQLQGFYTYSRAVGAAEDFQSRLGNDPSTVESEFGPLDFDQRHVIKLNASTFLPRDWQLGFAASWSSGVPYSVIDRFFALDNVNYQQFRTRFGYVEGILDDNSQPDRRFNTVSRNSERNHAVYDFNVRAKKSFVIGRTSAALFIEVFNLLNSDDLRIVTFQPIPSGSGLSSADVGVGGQRLQLNATRRFGRRYQVGFQLSF